MSTQLTRYADQQVLEALIKGTALPATPTWLGLLVYQAGIAAGTTPTRDNVQELANAGSYGRVAAGAFSLTPVNGQNVAFETNNVQALYNEATGADWGNIVGVGFWDAQVNGNLWICCFTPVASQRIVRVGDRLAIPAGQIVVSGGAT